MTTTLHTGDCRDILPALPDCSVDAIVTDPPYGLRFMGRAWDYDVPPVEVWAECLRVLKPGGHLLAFAGTRTQHRMACNIEDAGFEIRDMIAWVYGSGFPKSHDVSKAIDKAAGAEREVVGVIPDRWAGKGCVLQRSTQEQKADAHITIPATDAARQWQGWGTALKPALEPITVARKPLAGTVAENVLEYGTGALNVDGCRVRDGSETGRGKPEYQANHANAIDGVGMGGGAWENTQGRWPANVIHDGSEEVEEAFAAFGKSSSAAPRGRRTGKDAGRFGAFAGQEDVVMEHNDSGTASRFFYCAKASKAERGKGNNHPTVKPLALCRYLVRLVTPPGGVVLDPFAGSGSILLAAEQEGFASIGVELLPEHVEVIRQRLAATPALLPIREIDP